MDRTIYGSKRGGDRDASLPPGRVSPDPMRGLFGAKVRQADEQANTPKPPRTLS